MGSIATLSIFYWEASMEISDLNFLEQATEESDLVSGAAGIFTESFVQAFGRYTNVNTDAKTFSFSSPYFGDVAVGYTVGFGVGYTPPASYSYKSYNWQAWLPKY
jgi:hypothetical protein